RTAEVNPDRVGGDKSAWSREKMWRMDKRELQAEEMAACWRTLSMTDAGAAYKAIWDMANSPNRAVPFLERRIRPAEPVASYVVGALVRDLESDDFATRKRATNRLENMAELVEPALLEAAKKVTTLACRVEIERLLERRGRVSLPERLQAVRGIEVLERINS